MSGVEPEVRITWKSVSLTVGGIIWVAYPPGSFDVHSDDRLDLYAILEEAMKAHGLEGRAADVFRTISALAQPHFAKAVDEYEKIRQDCIRDET